VHGSELFLGAIIGYRRAVGMADFMDDCSAGNALTCSTMDALVPALELFVFSANRVGQEQQRPCDTSSSRVESRSLPHMPLYRMRNL
jgi:hypothetical protein